MDTKQIVPIDYDVSMELLYRSTAQCHYRHMRGIGWVVETDEGETLPPMSLNEMVTFFEQRAKQYPRHIVI